MATTFFFRPHTSLTGMVLAASSFTLLSAVDTIFKLMASHGHAAYQILLFNGCFAMIPVLLWTFVTGGFGRLGTRRLPYHLARGAISVVSAFAAIFAYARLSLTEFYAIVFAGPLVVTAMSAFWLGEPIERQRWLAILAGFFGILVVTNPLASPLLNAQHAMARHEASLLLGRIAAFISVFCYALSVILIRRMRSHETNLSFSFYGYLASLLICGTLTLIKGFADFPVTDITFMAVSGILAGTASLCMMTAYHRAPVALVAPFQYTQIIWGALAGYFIWHHVPSHHLMAGAAIVALSGFYVIRREVRCGASGKAYKASPDPSV